MAVPAPTHTIPTFTIYRNRQERRRFKLYKDDGTAYELAGAPNADVVRAKFWLTNGQIDLDVGSDSATANGSVITVDVLGTDGTTPAEIVLSIDNDDAQTLAEDVYNFELGLVDHSQSGDPYEVIARGKVQVKGSPGGDIGL